MRFLRSFLGSFFNSAIIMYFLRLELNVEWVWVRLFEKESDPFVILGKRVWNSYYFPPPPTRFIFPYEGTYFIVWDISLRKLQRQPTRLYKVTFRLFSKPDGRLLKVQRQDLLIRSDAITAQVRIEWGWGHAAHWEPGDYEVQLLLDGVDVVKSWFTIGPAPPPPPPKPATEVLHQPLVRFYPMISETPLKETRQYNIRFPHQTTHHLICELTVRNLLYNQCDRTYAVTAQCYTVDEKLLWEDHHNWLIKSQEQESMSVWELEVPEGWSPGIYRVDILIDELDFAWGAFVIEA